MNKFRLPTLFAAACLAAMLLACGSRSIAGDAEAASDVFNDPEIKALLERSKPLDENYKPKEWLTHLGYQDEGDEWKFVKRKEVIPFFDFLDTVINKELADQPYEYRKAACKIILRYFLKLTPSLDSLYARQYNGPHERNRSPIPWDIAGDFIINSDTFGKKGRVEEGTAWEFIAIKEGKIVRFRFDADYQACGGYWSNCCSHGHVPECFDAEMIEDIERLGLVWRSSHYEAKLPVDTAAP